MSKYDDLFDDTAPETSVLADKGSFDPLAAPAEIMARDAQERQLATILNGDYEDYLPTTISVYGPPGTRKTLTARQLCTEFAEHTPHSASNVSTSMNVGRSLAPPTRS